MSFDCKAVIVFTYVLTATGVKGGTDCTDIHGAAIIQGLHFIPGPDVCGMCVCDDGQAKWCKHILCNVPENCRLFRKGKLCCDFVCVDETELNENLGLYQCWQPVTVSVIASLSLLLFFFFLNCRLKQQRRIKGCTPEQPPAARTESIERKSNPSQCNCRFSTVSLS